MPVMRTLRTRVASRRVGKVTRSIPGDLSRIPSILYPYPYSYPYPYQGHALQFDRFYWASREV